MNLQELFSADFGETLLRFILCLVVNWGIVNFLYFKKSHRRDFYFTFMIISVAIYFLVYLMMGMDRGKATMGVGLGLFGIFSIMRYRTDTMPVREMTYLFVVICLSVVHAMSSALGVDDKRALTGTPLFELIVIDAITVVAILVFECMLKVSATKLVQYLAKARSYGPIYQGFRLPVLDCSRGDTAERIYDNIAICSVLGARGGAR